MAQINIKIDDQLKDDVSRIFNEMGLDMTVQQHSNVSL